MDTTQERLKAAFREVVADASKLGEKLQVKILNGPPRTGAFREEIAAGLDNMLKESDLLKHHDAIAHKTTTLDGDPIVLDKSFLEKEDFSVELDNKVKVVIRYFPARPGSSNIPEGILFRIALAEDPEVCYNIRARRRPYKDFHFIMSNSNPQILDLNGLRAGLFILKSLGHNSSAFYNAAAPSYSKFHFQFFGYSLPLWENLRDDFVSISKERPHPVENNVDTGQLQNWLFEAQILSCKDPEKLANAIWHEVEEMRQKQPGMYYDLLMSIDDNETIRTALALRRGPQFAKPESFYPEDSSVYGDFGGLELCGLIVTIKEKAAFDQLKKSIK